MWRTVGRCVLCAVCCVLCAVCCACVLTAAYLILYVASSSYSRLGRGYHSLFGGLRNQHLARPPRTSASWTTPVLSIYGPHVHGWLVCVLRLTASLPHRLAEVKKKLKEAANSVVLEIGLEELFQRYDDDGSGDLDVGSVHSLGPGPTPI
jgi:hypothetical protein